MNRNLYKSLFENITVSEKALTEVLLKAEQVHHGKPFKRVNRLKLLVPVAAVLMFSIISVYAASNGVFIDFYKQFFNTETSNFSQSQLNFLESYGAYPNMKFTENGVTLNIEGMIGDNDYLYIKYSVSYEKQYDEPTLDAFLSPVLYIGKMDKNVLQPACTCISDIDTNMPNKLVKSAIYSNITGKSTEKTATFVITNNKEYQPIGIDLATVYKKYGSASINESNDMYNMSNSNLGIPFNNKYGGRITLNSIGFMNGTLILAVNSSEYYKAPTIYLRNKKTGDIYSRCDGKSSVSNLKGDLEYFPYKVKSIDMLKELEIVVPREYHFSFPLSYINSTKNIDISKLSPLTVSNLKIDNIRLSPISLNIDGSYTSESPLININDIFIRLKDKTIQCTQKNGYYSCSESDNRFEMGIAFESPIMLESVEAIIIKQYDSKQDKYIDIEIPVK